MTNRQQAANDTDDRQETEADDHLADVEPGAGCTEIWEHLSERRENEE